MNKTTTIVTCLFISLLCIWPLSGHAQGDVEKRNLFMQLVDFIRVFQTSKHPDFELKKNEFNQKYAINIYSRCFITVGDSQFDEKLNKISIKKDKKNIEQDNTNKNPYITIDIYYRFTEAGVYTMEPEYELNNLDLEESLITNLQENLNYVVNEYTGITYPHNNLKEEKVISDANQVRLEILSGLENVLTPQNITGNIALNYNSHIYNNGDQITIAYSGKPNEEFIFTIINNEGVTLDANNYNWESSVEGSIDASGKNIVFTPSKLHETASYFIAVTNDDNFFQIEVKAIPKLHIIFDNKTYFDNDEIITANAEIKLQAAYPDNTSVNVEDCEWNITNANNETFEELNKTEIKVKKINPFQGISAKYDISILNNNTVLKITVKNVDFSLSPSYNFPYKLGFDPNLLTSYSPANHEIPWFSVKPNEFSEIYFSSTNFQYLTFHPTQNPQDWEFKTEKKGDHAVLKIKSKKINNISMINVKLKGKEVLGRFQVACYNKQFKKIAIIPVRLPSQVGTDYRIDENNISEIKDKINKTYNQANVFIDLELLPQQEINYELPSNQDGKMQNDIFSNSFSSEAQNLINLYQKPEKIYDSHIFLLFSASDNGLGFMPFNQKNGFVFLETQLNKLNNDPSYPYTKAVGHIIAHELGHGLFGLRHPFDEFGNNGHVEGDDGENIMDYKEQFENDIANIALENLTGNLRKYQWDIIHGKNPNQ